MKAIKKLAIFGGAEAASDSQLFHEVFAVAKVLAEHKYTIIDGGGPGVMLAATQGAESVQGDTVSILLDAKNAPGFEGGYGDNLTDHSLSTPTYTQRIHELLAQSDCYIIFNGGTGTISELGMAWCLARLYYPHHKPFILYGEFWHEIIGTIQKNMMMRPQDDRVFKIVSTIQGVLDAIHDFDVTCRRFKHHHNRAGEERAFMR